MPWRWRVAAALCAATLLGGTASGAVTTIDFESVSPGLVIADNLSIGGFRFSPNCHYDLIGSLPEYGSQWIGFDGSACGLPDQTNANYLGPAAGSPSLWIDFSGLHFTLLGLDPVSLPISSWRATSSKGAEFVFESSSFAHIDFVGDGWSNIEWVLFSLTQDIGVSQGFDNIAFLLIPAPPLELLAVMAAGLLAWVRIARTGFGFITAAAH